MSMLLRPFDGVRAFGLLYHLKGNRWKDQKPEKALFRPVITDILEKMKTTAQLSATLKADILRCIRVLLRPGDFFRSHLFSLIISLARLSSLYVAHR